MLLEHESHSGLWLAETVARALRLHRRPVKDHVIVS